jgi:hypothetical protein
MLMEQPHMLRVEVCVVGRCFCSGNDWSASSDRGDGSRRGRSRTVAVLADRADQDHLIQAAFAVSRASGQNTPSTIAPTKAMATYAVRTLNLLANVTGQSPELTSFLRAGRLTLADREGPKSQRRCPACASGLSRIG